MPALKHTLIATVLTASLATSGCALVVGNDLGPDAWDGGIPSEYKEQNRDDRRLTRTVQRAIHQAEETRRAGIRVRSRDGDVLLLGHTGDADVVAHAIRIALEVNGVESATSRIELQGHRTD